MWSNPEISTSLHFQKVKQDLEIENFCNDQESFLRNPSEVKCCRYQCCWMWLMTAGDVGRGRWRALFFWRVASFGRPCPFLSHYKRRGFQIAKVRKFTHLIQALHWIAIKEIAQCLHDLVVGAVSLFYCLREHLCSETGKDWNEFLLEPGDPNWHIKGLELNADDLEGAVHDKVSHGWGDVGNLWKQDMNNPPRSLLKGTRVVCRKTFIT